MVSAIDRLLLNIEVQLHNAESGFKLVDKSLKNIGSALATSRSSLSKFELDFKSLQGALMGVGLSFLFTGMAIKNFFQGALNAMFQTFLTVEGETGAVNNAVNNLIAAFEFLKFSLVDAFEETGALDVWIDRLTSMIDFVTSLDESSQAWLVKFMIGIVIVSALSMVFGQVLLGVLGLITLIEYVGVAAFGFMAILLAALIALFFIWTSDMSLTEKILWTLVVVLLVIAAAILIFASAAALPFVAIAAGAALAIAVLALFVNRMGSVQNALKFLAADMMVTFAVVGDAIIEAIVAPLRLVLSMVNAAISASNSLLGTDFSTIAIPDELAPGVLTRKALAFRESVVAAAAEETGSTEATEETESAGLLESATSGVTNVFNIEGIISGDNLDSLLDQLNQKSGFISGSPQQ
jgi:hypothetical protein